jgi:hypothetical protein
VQYKYQYMDDDDKQSIIDANADKHLVEQQNLIDGNFLIFADSPLQPPEPGPLETENTALKLALAELAETQEADKLATQLALAELAEIIAGGA